MSGSGCVKRYDASKHRILSREDMIAYYPIGSESGKIVLSNMPHRYVCLPHVEIHINRDVLPEVSVYLIYPGETREVVKELSVRGLEGLRATYRGREGWSSDVRSNGTVILRREGRAILDPLRRFGVWNSSL